MMLPARLFFGIPGLLIPWKNLLQIKGLYPLSFSQQYESQQGIAVKYF